MIDEMEIEQILREKLPIVNIEVRDMTGSGDHWEVEVQSSAFNGKSMIEQHRLVYGALGDRMKADVHALKLKTLPTESAK